MQSSPPGLFIELIMGLFGKNEGPSKNKPPLQPPLKAASLA